MDKADEVEMARARDAEAKRWHNMTYEQKDREMRLTAQQSAAQIAQSTKNAELYAAAQTPQATTYARNYVTTFKANLGREPKPGELEQAYNKGLNDFAAKASEAKGTQFAKLLGKAIEAVSMGGPLEKEFAKATDKQKYLTDLTLSLASIGSGGVAGTKNTGGGRFLGFEEQ
jgi:hypothetical protein